MFIYGLLIVTITRASITSLDHNVTERTKQLKNTRFQSAGPVQLSDIYVVWHKAADDFLPLCKLQELAASPGQMLRIS